MRSGRSSPWWTTATPPALSIGRQSSYTWTGPHTGRKARVRYLRQRCREVLDPKDDAGNVALASAVVLAGEFAGQEEMALLIMASRAWDIHEQTGVPWPSALDYVVQKERADRLARAAADEETRSIITPDQPPDERGPQL